MMGRFKDQVIAEDDARMVKIEDMGTARDIPDPDFIPEPDGTSYCRHCGVVKEASASFFLDHARECVEPRRREGQDG